MAVSYELAFAVLVLAYLIASYWAGLDPRWPVAGAAAIVVATALASVGGNVPLANTLAPYALLLLGGGVVLLIVSPDRPTSARAAPVESAAQTRQGADQRDGPSQDPLHHFQQEPVAVVDRSGEDDGQDEQPRDRQSDHG
jgi:hypothetical protein